MSWICLGFLKSVVAQEGREADDVDLVRAVPDLRGQNRVHSGDLTRARPVDKAEAVCYTFFDKSLQLQAAG